MVLATVHHTDDLNASVNWLIKYYIITGREAAESGRNGIAAIPQFRECSKCCKLSRKDVHQPLRRHRTITGDVIMDRFKIRRRPRADDRRIHVSRFSAP